jgi:hypothetical protein
MLNTLVFEAIPTIAMASSISSSSSDEDYESDDCATNSEGPESESEAISTYSNNESNEDEEASNEAIPRHITRSFIYAITLFTNAPNPNAIDDELL